MNLPCDCCQGPGAAPSPIENRPGLGQLRYRVGTHASFFGAMLARLSSGDYPQLAALRTRAADDPSIALLDAWACVADVLTFYQERIANEGYLRTATERRSVLELARLAGYALRPGVSATVYLAYTLDQNAGAPVVVPAGARANSIPGPGEQMQAFETAEPLEARVAWNALKPRLTEPQTARQIKDDGLYLKGIATRLKPNDPLLIDLADGQGERLLWVATVREDSAQQRTHIALRGEGVQQLVRRFSDLARFGLAADSAPVKRVMRVLGEIAAKDAAPPALALHLDHVALPKLEAELAKAGPQSALQPWLAALTGQLRDWRARMPGQAGARAGMGLALNGSAHTGSGTGGADAPGILGQLVKRLTMVPSLPPPGARQLARDVTAIYGAKSDTLPRLLTQMRPALKQVFYSAWKSLPAQVAQTITVRALRVTAQPFGHNAPLRQTGFDANAVRPTWGEWAIGDPWNMPSVIGATAAAIAPESHAPLLLFLDADYDLAPDSPVVIDKGDGKPIITRAVMTHRSFVGYGLSGKTLRLDLPEKTPWFGDLASEPFATVRGTRVYGGGEALELAERPVADDVAGDRIELGDLYEDLTAGRWLIVAGERSDTDAEGVAASGVMAAELVMLAGVTQQVRRADAPPFDDAGAPAGDAPERVGERIHTYLTLAKPLAYRYKRERVTIYGNVVKASNGDTRAEVLGAGDAGLPLQQFTLKQPPLTYVSAATVSGVASTLEVRVDEVRWREAENLALLGPGERRFVASEDEQGRTSIVFGDGVHGARLPTGVENVKAVYRGGIGKGGNVKPGQISLLGTRPLGVKEVINPIRASGGADRESRDQARANTPLALMALDRLVSVTDYADFSRTFGGVAKADARRMSNGRQRLLHVTVAGVDDGPIDDSSDLYRNLLSALHRYGDPYLPLALAVRERLALVLSARVRIDPEREWDLVEPALRAALLTAFGFERVALAQDLLLAEAVRVAQAVPGVVYADIDVFDTIAEGQVLDGFAKSMAGQLGLRPRIALSGARFEQGRALPAQLAYLSADVPDTLLLQEIAS